MHAALHPLLAHQPGLHGLVFWPKRIVGPHAAAAANNAM
jgi:hypothetical protein